MPKILGAILFQIGFVISIIIWAPVVLALFWLKPIPRYRVIRQWGRFTLWWLGVTCRLSYVVTGRSHIPKTPCVILSNHQSTWETLAYQWIFPPHVWVLKRELLWIPLLGWGMALSEPIAINRDKKRKAIDQVIASGQERLASGRHVIIFPEGTRMPSGQLGRFKLGGARLAHATGCAVLPVAHNAGRFWARRSFLKEPGVIQVVIGEPIESQHRDPAQLNALAENWIARTTAHLDQRVGGCPLKKDARYNTP